MPDYQIWDEESSDTITAADWDDACEQADSWIKDGEWGDDGARVSANVGLLDEDGDVIDRRSVEVEIEPNHEALIEAAVGRWDRDSICGTDPDDHDWTSEGEGGCDENPGVWSTGGTSMTFTWHCRVCGLHRTEYVTGSQHNPGEHDTVVYRLLDEDEIESHRQNGTMDEADDA